MHTFLPVDNLQYKVPSTLLCCSLLAALHAGPR